MKGRPEAKSSEDFVNSKQRLRAALRNVRTVKEVDNKKIQEYRRYKVLAMEGVYCVPKSVISGVKAKKQIPDGKLKAKTGNNTKCLSCNKTSDYQELKCNRKLKALALTAKVPEKSFPRGMMTRSLRAKKQITYYESDSDKDEVEKLKTLEENCPQNKFTEKFQGEGLLDDSACSRRRCKQRENRNKTWISEINRRNEMEIAAKKTLTEVPNLNSQVMMQNSKPPGTGLQFSDNFNYSCQTKISENTEIGNELFEAGKKLIPDDVKSKMETIGFPYLSEIKNKMVDVFDIQSDLLRTVAVKNEDAMYSSGKSCLVENHNVESNYNKKYAIPELNKNNSVAENVKSPTDSFEISCIKEIRNTENSSQFAKSTAYNFQNVKEQKEEGCEICEKNGSKVDSYIEDQIRAGDVYHNNMPPIKNENLEIKYKLSCGGSSNQHVKHQSNDIHLEKYGAVIQERSLFVEHKKDRISGTRENFQQGIFNIVHSDRELNTNDTETNESLPEVIFLYDDASKCKSSSYQLTKLTYNFQNVKKEKEESCENFEKNRSKVDSCIGDQMRNSDICFNNMPLIRNASLRIKCQLPSDGLSNPYVKYERNAEKSDVVIYQRTLSDVNKKDTISGTDENLQQGILNVHSARELNVNNTETNKSIQEMVLYDATPKYGSSSFQYVKLEPQEDSYAWGAAKFRTKYDTSLAAQQLPEKIFESDSENEEPCESSLNTSVLSIEEELSIIDELINDDNQLEQEKLLNKMNTYTEVKDTRERCVNSYQEPVQDDSSNANSSSDGNNETQILEDPFTTQNDEYILGLMSMDLETFFRAPPFQWNIGHFLKH